MEEKNLPCNLQGLRDLSIHGKSQALHAFMFIMNSLPNKGVDRSLIIRNAKSTIRLGPSSVERTVIYWAIEQLVNLSPEYFGVFRKERYWKIVFSVFGENKIEIVKVYLTRFPKTITQKQHERLLLFLQERFGLSLEHALEEVSCFQIRPSRQGNCQDSGYVRCKKRPKVPVWA